MSYKETQIQKYLRTQLPLDKKYGPYVDITARNAIPTEDRYQLLIVGVIDGDGSGAPKIFFLKDGITNNDWVEIGAGSGGGGGVGIENRYSDITTMVSSGSQVSQTDKGLQFVLDASIDPLVSLGYAYYEYLGTTNNDLTDYTLVKVNEKKHDYKTWYVDVNNGSDVFIGDFNKPFKTVQKAYDTRIADGFTGYGIIVLMVVDQNESLTTTLTTLKTIIKSISPKIYTGLNILTMTDTRDIILLGITVSSLVFNQTGTNLCRLFAFNTDIQELTSGTVADINKTTLNLYERSSITLVALSPDLRIILNEDSELNTGSIGTLTTVTSNDSRIIVAATLTITTLSMFRSFLQINDTIILTTQDFSHQGTSFVNKSQITVTGTETILTGEWADNTPNFGVPVIKTIVVGVVEAGVDRNLILAAETGTADDVIEITGIAIGKKVLLRADVGDTNTLKHNDVGATNKILVQDNADFILDEQHPVEFIQIATNELVQVYDEAGSGSGGLEIKTWYISSSGNDTTGDGSPQKPFLTWQKSHDVASSMDTIISLDFGSGASIALTKSLNIKGVNTTISDLPGISSSFSKNVFIEDIFVSGALSIANCTISISHCQIEATITGADITIRDSVITKDLTAGFVTIYDSIITSSVPTIVTGSLKFYNCRIETDINTTSDVLLVNSIVIGNISCSNLIQENSVITGTTTTTGTHTIKNQKVTPNFKSESTKTIATGIIATGTDRNLIIAAQTGTSDDLIEITGLTIGDKVLLRADAGDVITVKHNDAGATIKILIQDNTDFILDEAHPFELILTSTNELVQVYDEVGSGGGGGSPSQFRVAFDSDLDTVSPPILMVGDLTSLTMYAESKLTLNSTDIQSRLDIGSSGTISAVADAGGGDIRVSAASHGRSVGENVEITGTTSYNGTFTITNVNDAGTFDVTATFGATETGNWTTDNVWQDITQGAALTDTVANLLTWVNANTGVGVQWEFRLIIVYDASETDESSILVEYVGA